MADDPESTLLVYSEDGKLLQPDLSNRNIRAAFEVNPTATIHPAPPP